MNKFYLTIGVALASLLLFAAGCGSSDDGESTLTKKQFAAQAEQICKDAEAEQSELANAYLEQHPNAKGAQLIEPAGFPPLEKQLVELESLASEAEDRVMAYVDAFAEDIEKAKQHPEVLLAADASGFDKSNQLATSNGLDACAHAP
jgi:ABC-type glycerol-3-phosphate transport system substrate-binding protein